MKDKSGQLINNSHYEIAWVNCADLVNTLINDQQIK